MRKFKTYFEDRLYLPKSLISKQKRVPKNSEELREDKESIRNHDIGWLFQTSLLHLLDEVDIEHLKEAFFIL